MQKRAREDDEDETCNNGGDHKVCLDEGPMSGVMLRYISETANASFPHLPHGKTYPALLPKFPLPAKITSGFQH